MRQRDKEYDDRYSKERRRGSLDRDRDVDRERIAPSAHIMVRGSPSALTKEDDVSV